MTPPGRSFAGADRLLVRAGVDPRRFRLLTALFDTLGRRREVITSLGRDPEVLRVSAWLYFGLTALVGVLFLVAEMDLERYFLVLTLMAAFLLFTLLLAETVEGLVNPVEGRILAHLPVPGATYTAAKLAHLARILLFLVPGLNAAPALLGLALDGARWFYPLGHLLAGAVLGLLAALLAITLVGWLVRFIPARRLRATAAMLQALPLLALALNVQLRPLLGGFEVLSFAPVRSLTVFLRGHDVAGLPGPGAAAILLGLLAVLGWTSVRMLSGDYLIRVSALAAPGGRTGPRTPSGIGRLLAAGAGGPPGRAALGYVRRLAWRDWQFRTRMLSMLPAPLIGFGVLAFRDLDASPFAGAWTYIHVLPHLTGFVLLSMCLFLVYGHDYKGAWLFLLAPGDALAPFARGVHLALWAGGVLLPHAVLLPVFAFTWGLPDAALFTAYSLAVASLYLALELRLIDGLPFGRQADPSRGAVLLPLMIAATAVAGAAVAVQYWIVFPSRAGVGLVAIIVGGVAVGLTRRSVQELAGAIRRHLDAM